MSDWIAVLKEGFGLIKLLIRKKLKPSNVFKDDIEVRAICKSIIRSELSVDCLFLMLAHNGGRKLHPLTLKYRSIVEPVYEEWLLPRFEVENYMNLPVDLEYKKLLSDIYNSRYNNDGISLDVEKIHGELKNKFVFENLKFVKYFFLKYSDEGMYYLMVGTVQHGEKMNDIFHKQKLYFAVNKIKNIIKKY